MTTEVLSQQTNENKQSQNNIANKDQVQLILNEPNVKFPLEDSWSFWFYKNERTKEWKENVKFITTVDFVEDFWGSVKFFIILYFCSFNYFKLIN